MFDNKGRHKKGNFVQANPEGSLSLIEEAIERIIMKMPELIWLSAIFET